MTAFCPVTHQPDFYTVKIQYAPNEQCIESKSLKLYLQSFRGEGKFAEQLASEIAQDIHVQVRPDWVRVVLTQHVRGGIELKAIATVGEM
ncbi:MAG: preQ(1) synthase [Chloroflexi bacterium]|nr:MAG: preQ(1) synthase [Chloroflexota bacterium]